MQHLTPLIKMADRLGQHLRRYHPDNSNGRGLLRAHLDEWPEALMLHSTDLPEMLCCNTAMRHLLGHEGPQPLVHLPSAWSSVANRKKYLKMEAHFNGDRHGCFEAMIGIGPHHHQGHLLLWEAVWVAEVRGKVYVLSRFSPCYTLHHHPAPLDLREAHAQLTYGLSPRLQQVLQRVALGHSDREIADALNLSTSTVQHHKQNILRKKGAVSFAQLFARMVQWPGPTDQNSH